MDQLIGNLLKIDEIMQDIEKFISIKDRIESLDPDNANKLELIRQTDLLINVLNAFST